LVRQSKIREEIGREHEKQNGGGGRGEGRKKDAAVREVTEKGGTGKKNPPSCVKEIRQPGKNDPKPQGKKQTPTEV